MRGIGPAGDRRDSKKMSTTDAYIKPIDPTEIPPSREIKHGPLREWADEVVGAFIASDLEAAELTGWPDGSKTEAVITQLRGAVRRCAPELRTVKVTQRRGRMFIQQPRKPHSVIEMPKPSGKRVQIVVPRATNAGGR